MKSVEESINKTNIKSSWRYSRISSSVQLLKLILLLLLFATDGLAQTVPPTTFIDLEYSYDGVGNVTSIIDHNDPQNNSAMQYDSLDRLTGSTGPWGPGSFNYDAIGNRTSKNIGSNSKNYSYNPSDNRLSGYSHDANGNLLQDDNFTYVYDSENRLVRVLSGANVITEYKYDGDGRRISKTANGETTYYAYGTGLNVLTEFNNQGVPKFDYIYAGNKNIARVNFDANGAPESRTFYHSDHLGSSLAITDAFTTVVWNQSYLPFGESYSGTGTLANSHQYTGKEYESETGLYYYGARYYHPGFGRFMSVDPAGIDITNPQSLNRYAYVQNSPFKFVDPDGEFLETAWDAFNISLGVISLKRNLSQGSYLDAAIDAGGIIIDSAAAIAPFVPGGVGLAIKATRVGKGTTQIVNEGLPQLTKGTGKTVLGHYPEYVQLANDLRARRFNIPEQVWNKMSEAERWGANKKFLDRLIARGEEIILATPLSKLRPGSYFARELEYLASKGFRPNVEGSKLIRGD
jgi:RHS repeat-associated protein